VRRPQISANRFPALENHRRRGRPTWPLLVPSSFSTLKRKFAGAQSGTVIPGQKFLRYSSRSLSVGDGRTRFLGALALNSAFPISARRFRTSSSSLSTSAALRRRSNSSARPLWEFPIVSPRLEPQLRLAPAQLEDRRFSIGAKLNCQWPQADLATREFANRNCRQVIRIPDFNRVAPIRAPIFQSDTTAKSL